MSEPTSALHALTDRLTELAAGLDDASVTASAYPTEWTIAHTYSHLGSGAVITGHRLAKGIGQGAFEEGHAQPIWDEWNAKSPTEQVRDSVTANQDLLRAIEAVDDAQRETFEYMLGPFPFDFDGFVMLRLNELALHSWDVAVALDEAAVIQAEAVPLVVDNLDLMAGWTAKAQGDTQEVDVQTTDPQRTFRIDLRPDQVTFEETETSQHPDLVLPAEAFIRLIYGRLDADHAPDVEGDAATLDVLRSTFPGP